MSTVSHHPEPEWLVAKRRDAAARFAAVGLPTSRLEAWKWSSTRALAELELEPADTIDVGAAEALVEASRIPEATAELVFVAGRYVPSLSRVGETHGLTVVPLGEAFGDEALRQRLGGLAAWDDPADAFTALNTSVLQDGVVVQAGRDCVRAIVHVLCVSDGTARATSAHLRNVLVAATGAELTFAETYVGRGGASLTTVVDEVFVEPGARVSLAVLGDDPAGSHLVHTLRARIDRDAVFRGHTSWIGGGWTRSDVDLCCAGPGAEAVLDGVLVLGGSAHVDAHTRIEHAVPDTTSREAFEAVLGGRSRGIFDGLVVVQPDAQRTDARQSSRNLLVSDDATANAKPTLEIYADDVKCAHGTTVGQLDREQVMYLRSRGIPLAEARQLLTGAFVAERVAHLEPAVLQARLAARVTSALQRLQEGT